MVKNSTHDDRCFQRCSTVMYAKGSVVGSAFLIRPLSRNYGSIYYRASVFKAVLTFHILPAKQAFVPTARSVLQTSLWPNCLLSGLGLVALNGGLELPKSSAWVMHEVSCFVEAGWQYLLTEGPRLLASGILVPLGLVPIDE